MEVTNIATDQGAVIVVPKLVYSRGNFLILDMARLYLLVKAIRPMVCIREINGQTRVVEQLSPPVVSIFDKGRQFKDSCP